VIWRDCEVGVYRVYTLFVDVQGVHVGSDIGVDQDAGWRGSNG